MATLTITISDVEERPPGRELQHGLRFIVQHSEGPAALELACARFTGAVENELEELTYAEYAALQIMDNAMADAEENGSEILDSEEVEKFTRRH